MSTPQQWLEEIIDAAESLLEDETLNQQQLTFIENILHSTQKVYKILLELPTNEKALRLILPIISFEFRTPQVPIIGYSQLLLEHPEQFEAKELSELQSQKLNLIYNNGNKIRDWTQSIMDSAKTEQQQMQDAPAQATNLNQFFDDYFPLYYYFLKNNPSVELIVEIPKILPFVMANPYHLSHLIEHIILTIAAELIEQGEIHLSVSIEPKFVNINIVCDNLNLIIANIDVLFEKQGRYVYRKRLEEQGGKLYINSETGISIYLERL